MKDEERSRQVTGSSLILVYSLAISLVLFLFIPNVMIFMTDLLHDNGFAFLLSTAALLLFSLLISFPTMKLSRKFLTQTSKYFAIACGLVVGLPVTIMLIYNGFFLNLYAGGFSAFVVVAFGGLAPILFTYVAVLEPRKLI